VLYPPGEDAPIVIPTHLAQLAARSPLEETVYLTAGMPKNLFFESRPLVERYLFLIRSQK
jgi:hypothetical protein